MGVAWEGKGLIGSEPMGVWCGEGLSEPMGVWHGRSYLWYVGGCGAGLQ